MLSNFNGISTRIFFYKALELFCYRVYVRMHDNYRNYFWTMLSLNWSCWHFLWKYNLEVNTKSEEHNNFVISYYWLLFSIWTVDLAYLLQSFSVSLCYFTVMFGANLNYCVESFYKVIHYYHETCTVLYCLLMHIHNMLNITVFSFERCHNVSQDSGVHSFDVHN